ncbi:hypothetical protein DL98DRAFT_178787 [Cadophora sp. DSE1049]|nr:hypothetical protein DL98DRAFT_178787 [Cadophora sp. DSE1049]
MLLDPTEYASLLCLSPCAPSTMEIDIEYRHLPSQQVVLAITPTLTDSCTTSKNWGRGRESERYTTSSNSSCRTFHAGDLFKAGLAQTVLSDFMRSWASTLCNMDVHLSWWFPSSCSFGTRPCFRVLAWVFCVCVVSCGCVWVRLGVLAPGE